MLTREVTSHVRRCRTEEVVEANEEMVIKESKMVNWFTSVFGYVCVVYKMLNRLIGVYEFVRLHIQFTINFLRDQEIHC